MASRHASQTSRSFYPPDLQDGTLEIEVKYASNLKNTDFLKNSDPYCTIDIEGKNFATAVLYGAGKHPIWNYSTGPVGILKTTHVVRFAIKDKDRFTEDDIMGYATLDLKEVRQCNFVSVQLPVKRPSGKEKGTLAVNARYTPPAQSTLDSLDSLDLPAAPSRASHHPPHGSLHPGRVSNHPSGRTLHSTLGGASVLGKTGNFGVTDFDIDPDEVMLRESRKVLNQFSTELHDVEREVKRLQKERKDLLPSDPNVSIVQYIMQHPDEFMEVDERLKAQTRRQATLQYGISELKGMEELVKQHGLVEPEVVQPLQQFILTGVTREVARLGDENSEPESMVKQVKQTLGNVKMNLQRADSLQRIQIWKDMLQDLFKQRAQNAAGPATHRAAAPGGQDEEMRFRSNLWGKAKNAAPISSTPPPPMAITDSNVQQNIMNNLEAIINMLGQTTTISPIRTSLPDDIPPPPPPDYDEPPSPPPPPPDEDEPPPPPPDDPYYGNQTAPPPPPPPGPPGRNTILEGENVGPRAPPPPPPLGLNFGPKKQPDGGVMRTAEVSDLYLELTKAVMGQEPKKKVVATGGNKSDLIAELMRKSPFHGEVKAEVQQYGYLIEKLAKEIIGFTCSDMESAVLFMRRVDAELSVMKHEVEVLNHYSAIFPTQRYWTIREAAYLYQDLQAMRHKIHHWDTSSLPPKESIGRIDQFYNKLVWRIDKLLQSQEETVKRFKSEGMPWDNIYVQRVQHDALKLVTLHMDFTLQEVASLESQLPPCPELTDQCFKLLSSAAHFAVKGHQFAGGLDPMASTKFQDLANVARKYKDLKLKEQLAAAQ